MGRIAVISRPEKMAELADKLRRRGKTIGLVPTLGFLHAGHASLIAKSVAQNDCTVVTVFVNPTQFHAAKYRQYPRDLKRDTAIAARAGADYIFAPSTESIYPPGFSTSVETSSLFGKLEGKRLTWFYKSVATIVAKLLNIAKPHRAYFGQKDPHQLAVIRRFVADLNFGVEIVPMPTLRAESGIAMSSRNALLNGEESKAALVISRAIFAARDDIKISGRRKTAGILAAMRKMISTEPLAKIDHLDIVDAESLDSVKTVNGDVMVYAAVFIGGKRLTDNVVVKRRK